MSSENSESQLERLRFVDRVFETFSWRDPPEEIWIEETWEADQYRKDFSPVPPREFDFRVFEAHPFHSQGDRLCFMTVQGLLYYLPSFISLVLEDIDRTNGLEDAVLGTLRSYPPYAGLIDRWIWYAREQPSFKGLGSVFDESAKLSLTESLKDWYVLKACADQCKHIVNMTRQEREIVAQYLDRYDELLVRTYSENNDANWTQSVRSMLRNDSYAKRLGAINDADILDLLTLLDVALEQYPGSIPSQIAESVRTRLKTELQ